MRTSLPPIGSKWIERDNRKARTIEVIRYDTDKRRVRIHCIETETLSWAKPERFNGKSGGYMPVAAAKAKAAPRGARRTR
ncbi:MAG TPA: hypothetical protein VK043_15670 [Burkholderiales bacterium]|nr:hypothetical protein [Burkholderiales bacterium]